MRPLTEQLKSALGQAFPSKWGTEEGEVLVIAGFIFYICPFTDSSQERDLAGLRVQISEIHLHWRCRRRWMWFILNGARPSHLEISIILNAIRQMAARNTPRWRPKPPPQSLDSQPVGKLVSDSCDKSKFSQLRTLIHVIVMSAC